MAVGTNVHPIPGRMLKAALSYADDFHFAVFPCFEITAKGDCSCPMNHRSRDGLGRCGSPGKHPRTSNGCLAASTDRKRILRWWDVAKEANVGIATGRTSGIVVVDIDPRNGGDDSWRALCEEHGEPPDTPQALTGGGGIHYLFKRPDVDHVKGTPLARGVDIKADGGYIIAAPSNHVSGKSYAWDLSNHIKDVPLAPLPAWIATKLEAKRHATYVPANYGVRDGFIGLAFEVAGWFIRPLGPDKAAVRCPWEDDHSSGTRGNGSTIVYAPYAGSRRGWFHCSHEHCRGRSLADVLAALPEKVKAETRRVLNIAPEYDPAREDSGPGARPIASKGSGEEWHEGLRFSNDGRLAREPGNAALLLCNLPEWAGCLEYDAFADTYRWVRPIPLIPGLDPPHPGEALADHHILYVQQWLAKFRHLSIGREGIYEAIQAAARRRTVHPVLAYLNALEWDETPRLATWLTQYCGAVDDPITSRIGIRWLVSAIARIRQPGCQADHLLILEGPQGVGKSSVVRTLAGDWYLGSLPDLRSKDAHHALAGNWIVEIGELDVFRGVSATRVKDWVTQTVDKFRPAYARAPVTRPRSCVFVGTTNENRYLQDATGARRFWPVQIGAMDLAALRRDRDQLWAEAQQAYAEGVEWWPSAEDARELERRQESRYREDAWEGVINDWLMDRTWATVDQVLGEVVKLPVDRWGRSEQMRVSDILKRAGWVRDGGRVAEGDRLNRRWVRRQETLGL